MSSQGRGGGRQRRPTGPRQGSQARRRSGAPRQGSQARRRSTAPRQAPAGDRRSGTPRESGPRRRARGAGAGSGEPRSASRGPTRLLPEPLRRGQRPFVLAFIVLLVALVTMGATPAQRYLETRDRVESLTQQRDELASDVEALEERKARLQDPDQIELIARRELGLVEPGEIPYVIVRPGDDQPQLEPDGSPAQPAAAEDEPWWRRLGEAVGLLGDDDAAPRDR